MQEALLRNYSRFITEDLEEVERRRRHRSDSDEEEEPRSNPNLFHTKDVLSLPRWRKTVAALLDAEEKPLRNRLDIFHTMAQAYTATVSAAS